MLQPTYWQQGIISEAIHEKIHYETYRPGIIEWAVVCFVVLLAADKIIFGPIV